MPYGCNPVRFFLTKVTNDVVVEDMVDYHAQSIGLLALLVIEICANTSTVQQDARGGDYIPEMPVQTITLGYQDCGTSQTFVGDVVNEEVLKLTEDLLNIPTTSPHDDVADDEHYDALIGNHIEDIPDGADYEDEEPNNNEDDNDENINIISVAFTIVEGETEDAWSWFLWRLCQFVVKHQEGVCLISDRGGECLEAVENARVGWQPPLGHHVFCLHHIVTSLNTKFQNRAMRALFMKSGEVALTNKSQPLERPPRVKDHHHPTPPTTEDYAKEQDEPLQKTLKHQNLKLSSEDHRLNALRSVPFLKLKNYQKIKKSTRKYLKICLMEMQKH
ncbi:uncharacterized protein G2W53_000877 [Senna tora]|uniref:MULE transposase domain-containing protein n=1 Tax=Senna tora TaxID=362788 RepID=A0A834XF57_9FABA|nr:uncharacterized protein G2W53_000877 [Senna tora]